MSAVACAGYSYLGTAPTPIWYASLGFLLTWLIPRHKHGFPSTLFSGRVESPGCTRRDFRSTYIYISRHRPKPSSSAAISRPKIPCCCFDHLWSGISSHKPWTIVWSCSSSQWFVKQWCIVADLSSEEPSFETRSRRYLLQCRHRCSSSDVVAQ